MKDFIQAHIIFSGTVQGVGFRFTVERIALKLNLTGWVKNLPNGCVEAVIEGKKQTIEEFCENIEQHFKGYIRNKQINFVPAQGNFLEFKIAF